MSDENIWAAVLLLTAVGALLALFGFVQEHFFQKEIERQKRAGVYPYAAGTSRSDEAGSHPAE